MTISLDMNRRKAKQKKINLLTKQFSLENVIEERFILKIIIQKHIFIFKKFKELTFKDI